MLSLKHLAASTLTLTLSMSGSIFLTLPATAQTEELAPATREPAPPPVSTELSPMERGEPPFARRESESEETRMQRPADQETVSGEDDDARQKERQERQAKEELRRLKQSVRGLSQTVKQYEKQLARLAKQNISVPTSIAEAITQAKALLDKINNATTAEDLGDFEFDDVRSVMEDLEQGRKELEMLSRWPQTLKQIDQQLKRFTNELKRSKTTVDRLAKKDIDLSSVYAKYEEAISKLKAVRDEAVAKIQAGDAEEAFAILESGFFDDMEEVMQHQRVIQLMANLGRFTSEYKRGMTDLDRKIKKLERKKIDVSELKALQTEAKAKGDEIMALIKTQDFDPEEVMGLMQEMEASKVQFQDKLDELSLDDDTMPWEKGTEQFIKVSMPTGLKNFFTRIRLATP